MFLLLAAAIGLAIGLILGALGAGGGILTHRDKGAHSLILRIFGSGKY